VDAFAARLFGGNPAAVLLLDAYPDAARLQAIAAENNLAETAFLVPTGDDFQLRWFTPTCEELGLPFEREDRGGGTRPSTGPELRALNPVGLVPVIDDDGVRVWESNVIVRYLAASRGRIDLLPEQPAARARVEQWMDWQASDLNNTWRVAFQGLVRGNPALRAC
jgi:hypothetical protein